MLKNNIFLKHNANLNSSTSLKTVHISLKKLFLHIIFILSIFIISFSFVIYKYLDKIDKVSINKNDLNIKENFLEKDNTIVQNNDIKNIVLFGIDEPDGTAGRSDCIMVFTIDNKHNKLKLSSIVRDSYVNIPTKDAKDKINHAYAFGGPQLALKTLNENFNLNLNQFVTVNFSSLPKIIDDIGGITLAITNDELKYINRYIDNLNNINHTNSPNLTTPGLQKIDGTQALAYCRIRYTDGGDFERSNRHRNVLKELIEKCKTIPITQYPSLLNELLPLVHTNLESSDILSLSANLNSLKDKPLVQDRFPRDEDGEGKSIGGIYYYVFDEELTAQKIHEFIYEE